MTAMEGRVTTRPTLKGAVERRARPSIYEMASNICNMQASRVPRVQYAKPGNSVEAGLDGVSAHGILRKAQAWEAPWVHGEFG
jgi:hypothetical protein